MWTNIGAFRFMSSIIVGWRWIRFELGYNQFCKFCVHSAISTQNIVSSSNIFSGHWNWSSIVHSGSMGLQLHWSGLENCSSPILKVIVQPFVPLSAVETAQSFIDFPSVSGWSRITAASYTRTLRPHVTASLLAPGETFYSPERSPVYSCIYFFFDFYARLHVSVNFPQLSSRNSSPLTLGCQLRNS